MLQRFPLLMVLLPIVIGIFCCSASSEYISLASFFAISTFLVSVFLVTREKANIQYSIARFVITSLLGFSLGYIIYWWALLPQQDNHYSKHLATAKAYEVEVLEAPIQKPSSYKALCRVLSVLPSGTQTNGNLIVYFTRHIPSEILAGTRIVINDKLVSIKNGGNPGQFDYIAYCLRHNITHCCFVQQSSYAIISKAPQSVRTQFALWRHHILQRVCNYIKNTDAQAIAKALLLGDRTDIGNNLYEAYTKTGVAHIVAISGMHVLMVHNSLLYLLLLIPIFKKRKNTAHLVAIAAMWLFSLLIGMPASVMRACVMLTFISIGKILSKRTNSINMLCASAIVLLTFNPQWLFDIGFQLSYAALLGLLLFSDRWQQLAYKQHRWIRAIIGICTATLSAQIFTLPLCIYYFGQYPLIFIVSNLFAVTISTIILYILIVLCFVSAIPVLASALGLTANALIIFMNNAIVQMANISAFSVTDIRCTTVQLILLLITVAALSYAYLQKHKWSLYFAGAALLLFFVLQTLFIVDNHKRAQFIVYNAGATSVMQVQYGADAQIFVNTQTPKLQQYVLQPAHRALGTRNKQMQQLVSGIYSISLGSDDVLYCSGKVALDGISLAKPPSIVILAHNASVSPQYLKEQYPHALIVVDASNSLWKIEQLKKELAALTLRSHFTSEQGAYVVSIRI